MEVLSSTGNTILPIFALLEILTNWIKLNERVEMSSKGFNDLSKFSDTIEALEVSYEERSKT